MHPILGFVGPSGVGKTTLMKALRDRFPDQLDFMRSLVTRERRGPEDDLWCTFVTREDIEKRQQAGRLVQVSEYAGNLYANDREDLVAQLEKKICMAALVEQGVQNFRTAGFDVIVIRVTADEATDPRSDERRAADVERSQIDVQTDITIVNHFGAGGLERTVKTLTKILLTGRSRLDEIRDAGLR